MSHKTKPLLPTEIQINPDDYFYKDLLALAEKLQKDISDLCVLDWGCGRGRYVGFLLSQGVDAYGVDIDQNVIIQAKDLFETNNWDFVKRLKVIPHNNRTDFPDNFFDYILSDQVFEHVRDLDGLAHELSRITKKEGVQIHRWPAKFRVPEPHLFMPFVHWLPKGFLRYCVILVYVLLGREPHWEELKGKTILEKAATYSEYSHQKTYYRTISEIALIFRRHWNVEFDSDLSCRYGLLQKNATVLKLVKLLEIHFSMAIMKVKNG